MADRQRKFLLMMRAGSSPRPALFHAFPERRNYDVAMNYFSMPHAEDAAFKAAEFVFAGGLSKYHAAKQILKQGGLLGKYEGVLFLDEDLELLFDPSEFFDYCRQSNFSMAQPSLTHDSAATFRAMYCHPAYEVRLTNFVEVMAPYFSREFLEAVVESFDMSISGWGLDVFWGSHLRDGRCAAVVDRFTMRHPRAPDVVNGPYYRYLRSIGVDCWRELENALTRLGISEYPIRVNGGIQIVELVGRPELAPRDASGSGST